VIGAEARSAEAEITSGALLRMGRSTEWEMMLSEKKRYRTWTVQQKLEIVLAGLRGDRSVAEACREHQISEALFYG
jgi:transposase-like protein